MRTALTLLAHVTAPIQRINTFADSSMKRRMRPILNTIYQPMFHRIEVQVIEMMFEVTIIANAMLPKSALPDR